MPLHLLAVALLLCVSLSIRAESPHAATIETTLASDGDHIRQLVFDGDKKSYFASEKNATATDHFTFALDKPATIRSIQVLTGRPDGKDKLTSAILEISADGERFEQLATFRAGMAAGKPKEAKVQAIRIKPTRNLSHPLVVREIVLEADPNLAVFKHPVEFTVDVSDAPELKEWAEKSARICERWYDRINEELKSPRFQPPRRVRMTIKKMKGVAYTSGADIVGAADFFKEHPDDFGAMIHETAHVVQNYRVPGNPSWLVEGVADYVRFFKYEPGKIGRLNPRIARHDGSYRMSAAFLAYLTEKYDKEIVRKLNKMMREGEYKKEIFQKLTGKSLEKLGEEWRATLSG
jgi:hypothetical protein